MHIHGAQGGIHMNPNLSNAAGAVIAPKVLRGFKLSWLIYGAAAYYGLKYLNKRGILPNQTGAALGVIDQGINFAKNQFGRGRFGHSYSSSQPSSTQTQLPH